MKFDFKSAFAGLIAGAALLGVISVQADDKWNVAVSNQKFIVNGQRTNLEALNVNGNNYMKIRDLATLLEAEVDYDTGIDTVYIDSEIKEIKTAKAPDPDKQSEALTIGSTFSDGCQLYEFRASSFQGYKQIGKFNIQKCDTIRYDIKGEGKAMFLSASLSPKEDWIPALIDDQEITPDHVRYRTATFRGNYLYAEITATESGTYYLYFANLGDTPLKNVNGSVRIISRP